MGNYTTYQDRKTPRICIIGAGFSGLTAGIQLKRKLGLTSFTIYDENTDIGGTWYRNNYPGCACDIPSHLYSWSFEQNPNWTTKFASSSEILEYMKMVTQKYSLYPHIKFQTLVTETLWNELIKTWKITLTNTQTGFVKTVQFDIVITGTGLLKNPNIPVEFKPFQGTIFHSAQWDSSVNLSNKIVGVVGSGSSAIQIIPSIVHRVKELHCYQRTSPHVFVRNQKIFSKNWKIFYKKFPPFMWLIRFILFIKLEIFHSTFYPKSKAFKIAEQKSKEYMESQVQGQNSVNLRKKFTPTFEFGCKRTLFHNDYYPTLQLPNVTLHREKIFEIKNNRILCADGTETKLDVLILATGFKASNYLDPLRVVGKDSIDVNEFWKQDKPSLYLGISTNAAPNQFFILGPNTILAHSSVIFIAECQVNYILQIIEEMMSKGIRVIKPKIEIQEKYMEEIDTKLKKMIWTTGNCNSWYQNSRGNVTALWPYNSTTYWRRTRKLNLNDYDFE